MLETGRRTATSTSQLGLYSDHGDRYNRSRYGHFVRKFAIGVMVVVAVILVGIFLYDFTSATSVNTKASQESKHRYVLQNALKKSSNVSRKFIPSTTLPELNGTDAIFIQDRSDDENYRNVPQDETINRQTIDAEFRAQNLNNYKLRKRVLQSIDNDANSQSAEGKQLFDNHALVYRVRQRQKYPGSEEEDENYEETRPTPFHWELKTPQPSSFKRMKYPQLSQYRYPHSSRNIQDIIKYLTNEAELPNRGIKFAGVYVNPKKYDLLPEMGEMMSNNDRSEEEESASYPFVLNDDPFYQYKPKHPADVNLLATSNVRFSPVGLHRYSPYYDQLYPRPTVNYKQPTILDPQFDNGNLYASNLGKRRKPKPFSVMLDIYPITDVMEPTNKKTSRPRPQIPPEDFDPRRPIQFNRGPKMYAPPLQPIPVVGVPSQQGLTDEEEMRQQMIFHLNLYPRKKNKLSRNDIIHRSESMAPEERQQFMEKIMSPLETIAKHMAVEEAKFQEHEKFQENEKLQENEKFDPINLPLNRYQETILDGSDDEKNTKINIHRKNNFSDSSEEEIGTIPSNHKSVIDDDYASTEKYEIEAQKIVDTTTENNCNDCTTTVIINEQEINTNKSVDLSKDIDTIEGFQRFSEGALNKD